MQVLLYTVNDRIKQYTRVIYYVVYSQFLHLQLFEKQFT